MIFHIEVKTVVEFEHIEGETTSKHIATKFNLDVSRNLQRSGYLDKDNLPTKEGAKAITTTLVQGIVANIHNSHQRGFRDSAEHLRYIINEITRGFAAVAIAGEDKF